MRVFEQKQRNISKTAAVIQPQRKSKKEESFFKPVIQAKLKMGGSNDRYEREADAVADKVVTDRKAPGIQRKEAEPLNIQKKCANCEEEKKVQKKEQAGSGDAPKNEAPAIVGEVLQSSGKKLDKDVRRYMEPRFGYSFENVKIHTDSKAAKSAEAIQAKAYTSGNNIVFATGKYNPHSQSGKRLIAHELTHVLQQSSSRKKVQKKHTNWVQAKPVNEPSSKEKQPEEIQREPAEVIQKQHAPHQAVVAPHPRALAAVANMMAYKNSENILFDYWAGDCRDNNKDGITDTDRQEQVYDGAHFSGTYPGFQVHAGVRCRGFDDALGNATWHTNALNFNTNAAVKYRVCADLVSKALHDAGTGMPVVRSVAAILNHISHSRHFRLWSGPDFRGDLLPGDIFGTYAHGHGHVSIVVSVSSGNPEVVHLPGQSQLIWQGIYDPTVLNDVRRESWPVSLRGDRSNAMIIIARYLG